MITATPFLAAAADAKLEDWGPLGPFAASCSDRLGVRPEATGSMTPVIISRLR